MTTDIDQEEHEYISIIDGMTDTPEEPVYSYFNEGMTDTPDQYSHYQHSETSENQLNANMEPMRIESAGGTDNFTRCSRLPWWIWLLLAILVVIIAGVPAVLLFQFGPQQDHPERPTATATSPEDPILTDCQALYNAGYTTSGVYTISPNGVRNMTVYCEQSLDGGGWVVFQRRQNGRVNFFRTWAEYRTWFGDPKDEYWLGNENIYELTFGQGRKLMIEMMHQDIMTQFYVSYSEFWIEDNTNRYRLHAAGYSSTNLDDNLRYHNGQNFSTRDMYDEMHLKPCAKTYYGGWWYRSSSICYFANLNGLYGGIEFTGIFWTGLTEPDGSLTSVRMMLKTA